MNFSQFADLASDTCVSTPDAEENYYCAADVLNRLEVHRDTLRTRLWSGEKRFVSDEEEGPMEVVTASGFVKLALAGRVAEAEAIKVWIASEVVPLLFLTGAYSGLGADAEAQARVVREHASLTTLRLATKTYAALCGDAPEDRALLDYLAEEVFSALLEDGVFRSLHNDDQRTEVFEGLANLR